MTYWSRIPRISCGVGSLFLSARAASAVAPSSLMMSLQSSMHSSQMNTDGPAMSFLTSCWLLPQNEQYRTFSLEEPFFSAMDRDFDVSTGGCEDDSLKEIGTFPWRRALIPALLLLRRNC